MVQDSVGQRIGRFERREMGGGKGDMPRAGNGRDQMLAMADIAPAREASAERLTLSEGSCRPASKLRAADNEPPAARSTEP